MSLKSDIAEIVATLPGTPAFRYSRRSEENINGDNAPYPAVILIEPDQGGFNIQGMSGLARDRNNTFIQFLDKTVMGDQALDRETVVDAMKTLAVQFIQALNNSNKWQDIAETGYNWVLLVDYYDVNTAGIELNISQLINREPRPC